MELTPARTDERGAALFIVVMTIALLTATGVFAVHSASLVNLAAGYDRKATQALYVSEFALQSVVGDFAGKEDDYRRKIASGVNDCSAHRRVTAQGNVVALADTLTAGSRVPCYALDHLEYGVRLQHAGTDLSTAGGLFGRVVRPGQEGTTEAAFRVEITDLGPAPHPKAGTDLSGRNFQHRQVTFTTMGQVRPTPAAVGACDDANVQASSVQGLRAHVTFLSSN